MRIDLLLLDVDGVLVQYQRAQRVLQLANALRVPTQAVQAALYDSGLEAAHDDGTLEGPAYLARLGSAWAGPSMSRHGSRHARPPAILRRPCCSGCRACSCRWPYSPTTAR